VRMGGEVHGTVSGSCPGVTGFSVGGDEPSGSAARALVS
jgi:hypothetical protein